MTVVKQYHINLIVKPILRYIPFKVNKKVEFISELFQSLRLQQNKQDNIPCCCRSSTVSLY